MAEYRPIADEERHRWLAEADKFTAEARKVQAETIEAEAKAEQARINLLREQRRERDELADDKYHHSYRFFTTVNSSSVEQCIKTLTLWRRVSPKCSIEILFNSPGGSVVDGMVLYDYIQTLRKEGHHVTTMAYGMAASMGGILLQAGDKRIMHSEAWMLIHEVSFGAIGKMGEIEDTVDWAKRIQKRVLDLFAARCQEAGQNMTASHPLTKGQIERNWKRKDWWISSDECLKYGLVDEVQ